MCLGLGRSWILKWAPGFGSVGLRWARFWNQVGTKTHRLKGRTRRLRSVTLSRELITHLSVRVDECTLSRVRGLIPASKATTHLKYRTPDATR